MPRLFRARPTLPIAVAALVVATAVAACQSTAPSPAPAGVPSPTASAPAPTGPGASPTTAAAASGTPAPGASTDPAAVAAAYARIRDAVIGIRGLSPTAAVNPVLIGEEQLRENLQGEFDTSNKPADVAASQDELITMGLLPAGSSLRALILDLQSGQVAGYYSPEKDELFVVARGGSVGPLEQSTYAHEFTHQLQDQHFNLDGLGL